MTILRKAMFYLAFLVALPLLPVFTIGRICFFAILDAWDSLRRHARHIDPMGPR